MVRSPTAIGAFDAKTRLSELLREVELGACYVITRRGRPVAHLVPPPKSESDKSLGEVADVFTSIRDRSKPGCEAGELIKEGRKW